MRLPPRQSTAEADLMVPFQLVCLLQVISLGYVCSFYLVTLCDFNSYNALRIMSL